MFTRLRTFIKKRQALRIWKDQKRVKWLAEGRNIKEINKTLKLHKVKY